MKSPLPPPSDHPRWKKFLCWLIASFCSLVLITAAFIYIVDPFDVSPIGVRAERPVMDLNQRFYYPLIVRTKKFDSYVFGTSTGRLLNPAELETEFGGRFANLGMNSATAWEQMQLMEFLLRENGPPKTIVIGVDGPWCDEAADKNRLTFRIFPEWMYDKNPLNDWLHQYNGRTLEIAGRLVAYWLGKREPRIPINGYEVFVPPESEYDALRAKAYIHAQQPLNETSLDQAPDLHFPALVWLDDYMQRLNKKTQVIFVFMPIHAIGIPKNPYSARGEWEKQCKQGFADIAERRNALAIDFRIPSDLTQEDENFWDNLHARVPVFTRITRDMGSASRNPKLHSGKGWKILKPKK